MALRRPDPAFFGQYYRHWLSRDQIFFLERLSFLSLDQGRTSFITIGFGIRHQLFLNECFQPRLGFNRFFNVDSFRIEFFLLTLDLGFFQPRQLAQTQVKNGICLQIRQLEFLD